MKMIKQLTIMVVFGSMIAACSHSKISTAVKYEVLEDKGHKMLKGVITRSMLENDTAFAWFKENSKYGTPTPLSVQQFTAQKSKFDLLVFGGTWCGDTQNLLPLFYKLLDQSGYPSNKVKLVAVDRQKQSLNNLHITYAITNVPTFIVMVKGKEIGRVVEYGKTGDITKELGEIVAGIGQ